jgi:ankyrin repeat protein
MISKTRMIELVRGHDANAVDQALAATAALRAYRDERGRNWLHVCCMAKPNGGAAASVHTAEVLLRHYDVNDPAFVEGTWKATPLWHAIAFGRNVPLARFLLSRKSDPNHCLFAAAYNDDAEAIRLLARAGADLDQFAEGEPPLLHAVQYSRFHGAAALLDAGADPDAKDAKGRTALHRMLRKDIDPRFFELFARHGARTDIPDADGRTAAEILSRKRDPAYRRISELFGSGRRAPARRR